VIIRRMQVEGGFLDGLNLRFDNGLNVLIGGRGTGKSSIIELIRYCLDVPGQSDEEDAKRSLEQAVAVLQDGQVCGVSLRTDPPGGKFSTEN
jgi:predicted ATP-dependent endonuclease of OLD family